MERQKISVVINTYNASQHLEKALQAAKDFDEIVVCDMESTDNTLDIARKYGCKIVTFPRGEHRIAEPARTTAIRAATNPWVLVVDADEIITPELREAVYEAVNRNDGTAGYMIPRKNLFMGMYIRDFHYEKLLRLFLRDKTTWPPYIHSIPEVAGSVGKIEGYNICLLHLMDETIEEYVSKMNTYTTSELPKKANRHYTFWSLTWRPFWRFFKKYIMDGSFRMGTRGYIRALMAAYYQFILISKVLEKRYRK